MELDHQSLFGLREHSCSHWLRPPALDARLLFRDGSLLQIKDLSGDISVALQNWLASPLWNSPNPQFIGRIQRKIRFMGPYAGVDYNLTLCPIQGRLQHIYHRQPYAIVDVVARVDFIPLSGTLIWQLLDRDLSQLFWCEWWVEYSTLHWVVSWEMNLSSQYIIRNPWNRYSQLIGPETKNMVR